MSSFDIVVLGRGLFGSAAARHLAAASANVAVIGPTGPPEGASEAGAFSSHDDASRILRRTTLDMSWAILTDRSVAEYVRLEKETGIEFFHRRSGVHLVPGGRPSVFLDAADPIIRAFDLPCVRFDTGAEVRDAVPELRVPDDCRGLIEHPPAGYLAPHRLIAAQEEAARRRGATFIRDVVRHVRRRGPHLEVLTHGGQTHLARRVLVATGAYSRDRSLLPRPLDLRVKSETTILAQVSVKEATRLRDLPTVVFESATERLGMLYMAPPIRYPNGDWFIKMGCDTFADRDLKTAGEMNDWMRSGASDVAKDEMAAALYGLITDLELVSVSSKRCLITYTSTRRPMIDRIDEGLFVVTGGNGMGAKASDAIGALAAKLVADDEWSDAKLRAEDFAARFAEGDGSGQPT
jgi:sarcosine oxidase